MKIAIFQVFQNLKVFVPKLNKMQIFSIKIMLFVATYWLINPIYSKLDCYRPENLVSLELFAFWKTLRNFIDELLFTKQTGRGAKKKGKLNVGGIFRERIFYPMFLNERNLLQLKIVFKTFTMKNLIFYFRSISNVSHLLSHYPIP